MIPALLARLEVATEGSDALDIEIAAAMGWQRMEKYWLDNYGNHWTALPDWTTSLDAALTLVPENRRFNWILEWDDEPGFAPARAWITGTGNDESPATWRRDTEGRAHAPALALCIAALKAREAGR